MKQCWAAVVTEVPASASAAENGKPPTLDGTESDHIRWALGRADCSILETRPETGTTVVSHLVQRFVSCGA